MQQFNMRQTSWVDWPAGAHKNITSPKSTGPLHGPIEPYKKAIAYATRAVLSTLWTNYPVAASTFIDPPAPVL